MDTDSLDTKDTGLKRRFVWLFYFIALGILFEIYRLSWNFAYDPVQIPKHLIGMLFPAGSGFIFVYFAPLTAWFIRFWKMLGLGLSFLAVVAWILLQFFLLSTESFGYLIFGGTVMLTYWIAGMITGAISLALSKVSKFKMLAAVLPFVFLIVLITMKLSSVTTLSSTQCAAENNTQAMGDCYYKLALKTNNFYECFNIGNFANNIQYGCLEDVLKQLEAQNKLNPSICTAPVPPVSRPSYPQVRQEEYWTGECQAAIARIRHDCSIVTNTARRVQCQLGI